MIQAPRRAPRRGAFVAAIAVLVACETEPTQPPDPSEPTPIVTCDDGGPLTLTRTSADSSLSVAPWVELCTLCPADALSIELAAPDADPLPVATGWTRGGECAVAMPQVPIPAEGAVDATFHATAGPLEGEVTRELVLGGERGDDPPDLDDATYILQWDVARGRHPVQGDPRLIDPAPGPSLMVSFGAPDGAGDRAVTVGMTDADGEAQDPCVPTGSWGTARLDRRQLGGGLVEGAEILQPTPIPVLRGALQGRLNESGSGLFDITVLGVVDLLPLEPVLGPAVDFCALLSTGAGTTPCGPCTDPALGPTEGTLCFTAVWEWAAAARADQPLFPVDADALPPECRED